MGAESLARTRQFEDVFGETIKRVEKFGDVNDFQVWKESNPEIDFEEVDETFSGSMVLWEERSITELAFYVNYMMNPQGVEVAYELEVDGVWVEKRITDSERLWWMWLNGCFKSTNGSNSDKSKMTFFTYSNDGLYKNLLGSRINISEVEVISWNAFFKINN